jgi:aryl-alcohol dehydrogenase-like predicted oxidoreductase
MRYRQLGASGLRISTMTLGTMGFGGTGRASAVGTIDVEGARRQIGLARDAGVNLIDTADVYSDGLAEEIVGKALGSDRDEMLLATKVRLPMGGGPNDAGLSRHHVIRGAEASLRRLGTDHIDLYQLHQWDGQTPLEETLGALDALVQAGEVRYVGASNHSAWHLMKALGVADTIEVLVDIGSARGVSAAQVALAYILGKPAVTSVVVGARTESQLADNLAAAHLELTVDEVSRLDVVSAQPLQYPYWHQAKTASDRLGPADLSLLGRHLG